MKPLFETLVRARSGVCRFCGCTGGRACPDPGSLTGYCAWRDHLCTICTGTACRVKYYERLAAALRALKDGTCHCGKRKNVKQSFCRPCYDRLPWPVQQDLYVAASEGYACYYDEAVAFLDKFATNAEVAR
jgi:hypothetical protein